MRIGCGFECGLNPDSNGSENPVPEEPKWSTNRKNSCLDELDVHSQGFFWSIKGLVASLEIKY
jgi:hypothetical protein